MKNEYKDKIEMLNGDIKFWIEQDSSILMRVGTSHNNDFVEIESNEAREIGKKLIEMADKIDADLLS